MSRDSESESTDAILASQPSVVDAGPAFRLFARLGLVTPKPRRVVLRALAAVLFAWVPLFVLSLRAGHAPTLALLHDVEAGVRLLITLPLLIVAELPIDRWLRLVLQHFRASGVVGPEEETRWQVLTSKLERLVGAFWLEILVVGIVVVGVVFAASTPQAPVSAASWRFSPETITLTPAGWWYRVASRPLVQFLMLRWMWRLIAWGWFLGRVSKLNLTLQPTHPDGAAGLGFVGIGQGSFVVLAVAISSSGAGVLAQRILEQDLPLASLRTVMIVFVLFVLGLFIAPLFAFMPRLLRLRRLGQFEYGTLASRYMREFDTKWIRGRAPADEPFLGSADIQSLADMQNSFEPVTRIRFLPIDLMTLRTLALATAAPLLPVLCLKVPITELAKKILGLLL